ncbi:MAG: Fic family protein [Deltaproteobacteria bacterium]
MRTRYIEVDDRMEAFWELLADHRSQVAEFEQKLELSWIYHDNALEGIVLSGAELTQALSGGAVSDATLAPVYQEIRNLREAIDLIKAWAPNPKLKVNLSLVKKLTETLGKGIDGKDKALFRKDMPLHRTYFHDIHAPGKIADGMQTLLDFCGTAEFKEYHPIKQASVIHYGFMQIFPYTENSGRVARLLTNLILLRYRYLPAIIPAIDRQRYYETLRQPNTALRALVLEAEENALENAFKFFEQQRQVRPARRPGRVASRRRRAANA